MEGFYVVFDRENVQVGFAATTCGGKERTIGFLGLKLWKYSTAQHSTIKHILFHNQYLQEFKIAIFYILHVAPFTHFVMLIKIKYITVEGTVSF